MASSPKAAIADIIRRAAVAATIYFVRHSHSHWNYKHMYLSWPFLTANQRCDQREGAFFQSQDFFTIAVFAIAIYTTITKTGAWRGTWQYRSYVWKAYQRIRESRLAKEAE